MWKECSKMYMNTTRNMCTHLNICACLLVYHEYLHIQRGGIDFFCQHTHSLCIDLSAARALSFLPLFFLSSSFSPRFPSRALTHTTTVSRSRRQAELASFWLIWACRQQRVSVSSWLTLPLGELVCVLQCVLYGASRYHRELVWSSAQVCMCERAVWTQLMC